MKACLVSVFLLFFSVYGYAAIDEKAVIDNSKKNIDRILQLTDGDSKKQQLLALLNSKVININKRLLILNTITNHYYLKNNFNDALLFAEKAVKLAQDNHLPLAAGKALKNVGIMHYLKADIDIAIDSYQEALSYYNNAKDSITKANILNNIALAYAKKSDWIASLDNFKMADVIYQQYGSAMDKIDVIPI